MLGNRNLIGTVIGALGHIGIAAAFPEMLPIHRGPSRGVLNRHRDQSKWTGEDIRQMNARNGVGSPKHRVTKISSRAAS